MKILQVGLGNNPGGVEAFVMNYYRELSGMGISFDFICMYEKIAYEEEIKRLGGRIYYVPNVKKDYFGYVKQLRRVLEQEKYDAVHVNMLSAANIVPLRVAKEAGVRKIIAHSHNASAPGMVRKLMDRWNRPKINRYATAKLACGEAAGRWLFGDAAFENGEITLISNAIDVGKYSLSPEKREKLRRELGLSGRFVIGHVGRFDLQKNHDGLIDIFDEIVKREPQAVLCLVGDGSLRPQIQKKVREKGLGKDVVFAGVRPDVEAFLSIFDVFLFPSLFEGLPFTLLEAQANGLPCVVSDAITREAAVMKEKVRFLPLFAPSGKWAEAVLEEKGKERTGSDVIRKRFGDARFDIKQEAGRLKALYEA